MCAFAERRLAKRAPLLPSASTKLSEHETMAVAQGHRHTHSLSQNQKASLASAYAELGKELSSSKVRVVGNYTLGKVIGEGKGRINYG